MQHLSLTRQGQPLTRIPESGGLRVRSRVEGSCNLTRQASKATLIEAISTVAVCSVSIAVVGYLMTAMLVPLLSELSTLTPLELMRALSTRS